MTKLSPQAQAVMVAATMGNTNVINDSVYRQCISAALRAAALYSYCPIDRRILMTIADELENAQ